jgi:ubiquitin C-terminal hydrolase
MMCLSSILNLLHEDINKVTKKHYEPYPPIVIEQPGKNAKKRDFTKTWKQALKLSKRRNDSPIYDLYAGMYLITRKCNSCEVTQNQFQIYGFASIEICQP